MFRTASPFRLHGHAPLLIALLVCLLALPTVLGLVHSNAAAIRRQENRRMAVRPPLQMLRSNPQAFIKGLESWMKDGIGLRPLGNTLYRKCRYAILRDPPLPNITLGQDGHIFFNSPNSNPYAYFKALCLQQGKPGPELVQRLDATFSAASRVFQRQGARVIFAIAPTTLPLYADKLPPSVPLALRQACIAYPNQDFLLARLKRQGAATGRYQVFYPLELFQAYKADANFYPQKNYHWEGKSVYLFTRHLLKACGAVDHLQLDDASRLGRSKVDIAGFFGFVIPIQVYLYPYAGQPAQEMPDSLLQDFGSRQMLFHTVTDNSLTDRTALLIANSFGTKLQPHLARGFRHLYFLNTNLIPEPGQERTAVFATIARMLRPDYVFFVVDDSNVTNLPDWLGGFGELDRSACPASLSKGSSLEKSGQ